MTSPIPAAPMSSRRPKGAGYADLEIGLLAEAGLLTDRTVIATTVHALQERNDNANSMHNAPDPVDEHA
jgi:hypothetical protein